MVAFHYFKCIANCKQPDIPAITVTVYKSIRY